MFCAQRTGFSSKIQPNSLPFWIYSLTWADHAIPDRDSVLVSVAHPHALEAIDRDQVGGLWCLVEALHPFGVIPIWGTFLKGQKAVLSEPTWVHLSRLEAKIAIPKEWAELVARTNAYCEL